jgi:uncharacterized membrane protein YccF (DUF307 family)
MDYSLGRRRGETIVARRSVEGSCVRTIGNVLWLILAGFWLAIAYVAAGIANCLTIIGIPFGIASFKLAGYALWPFGRAVIRDPRRLPALSVIGNVLWLILGGLAIALAHVLLGILLCITIIGIPLGIASMKMARLALTPFGHRVVDARLADERAIVTV